MATRHCIASLLSLVAIAPAFAADSGELQQLRQELEQLKSSYEAQIRQIEQRLRKAEAAAGAPSAPAPGTVERSSAAAAPPSPPDAASTSIASSAAAPAPAASQNAFNPAISLLLSGVYQHLSQDPSQYRITGFVPSGDIGPGRRGFSLAETELGISANVDPWFYGQLTATIQPDNSVAVEEGFVQTTALGHGLGVRAGRFFSSIGYLNDQHSHAWDFVDNPLPYKAFLGGQFAQDGVQIKWLAPADLYVQFGAEIGRGLEFPATDNASNNASAWAAYVHVGGDIGESQTWRAGVSYLGTNPQGRAYTDVDAAGEPASLAFTGSSDLWIADFVWKWAPDGNPTRQNFKLQTEYLWRRESGTLTFNEVSPGSYASTQSGGYAQGVFQFLPRWRTALRYDWLDSGSVDYGRNGRYLSTPSFRPSRWTWMVDFNPSEFSRIRLQLANDRSREGLTDNQLFVQYQMSLGAHGAHGF
jgi:hypothetical protein